MNLKRVKELQNELAHERISYGELVEIDMAAVELGVIVTEEMTASDALNEIEQKLKKGKKNG